MRFVDLYTPLLLVWAGRLGLQHVDAADLVQDVLLQLHRKLPGFRYEPSQCFRAWLRAVFLNKHRERMRRRERGKSLDPSELDRLQSIASEEEDREDWKCLLHRGLELIRCEFNAVTWQAFWMYAIQEREVKEVASELQIAPGTVYAARSRVLARLRLELAQDFEAS